MKDSFNGPHYRPGASNCWANGTVADWSIVKKDAAKFEALFLYVQEGAVENESQHGRRSPDTHLN